MYVPHAAGASFRSLHGLPIAMTRAMEHVLLASKPHMEITAALHRAELLGLGVQPWLMRAVLASRAALDLDTATSGSLGFSSSRTPRAATMSGRSSTSSTPFATATTA